MGLAALLGLEALAVAVLGALFALFALGTPAPASGIAAGATLLLVAALLVAVAVGLVRARPWTRSAALVWQVMQILVGLYALQSGANIPFAAAAIVPGLIVLVLLFSPRVSAALARPAAPG